jgi:hypothetical protein
MYLGGNAEGENISIDLRVSIVCDALDVKKPALGRFNGLCSAAVSSSYWADLGTHLIWTSAFDVRTNGMALLPSADTTSMSLPFEAQKADPSFKRSALTVLPVTNKPPALCLLMR